MSPLLFVSLLSFAPAQVEEFPVVLVEGTAPAPNATPPVAQRTRRDEPKEPIPVRADFRARLLSSVHGL